MWLVCGGSGLLGGRLVANLIEERSAILVLNSRGVSLVQSSRTNQVSGANMQPDMFDRVFEHYNVDVVVNTIGATDVDRCELDPSYADLLNVTIPKSLSDACVRHGCYFINVCTDQLFAGSNKLFDENHDKRPVNYYGVTKALAEDEILSSNSRALSIRTNFFGKGIQRNSYSDYLMECLLSKHVLKLRTDVVFNPVSLSVLAGSLRFLCEKQSIFGKLNIGSKNIVSKYEFGCLVAECAGLDWSRIVPVSGKFDNQVAERALAMSLDVKLAEETFGCSMPSVREMLIEEYDFC